MTDEKLKEWRKLFPLLTAEYHLTVSENRIEDINPIVVSIGDNEIFLPNVADLEFIAVARTALPELLDEVERLRKEMRATQAIIDDHTASIIKQRNEAYELLEEWYDETSGLIHSYSEIKNMRDRTADLIWPEETDD